MHELLLCGQLHLNMAMTETTSTAAVAVGIEAVNGFDGLTDVDELDEAGEGLARHTLHDDVDGLEVLLADDTGVATKEGEDLGTTDGVGNLHIHTLAPAHACMSSALVGRLTFVILITPQVSGLALRQYSTNGKS